MAIYIEDQLPGVKANGFNTQKMGSISAASGSTSNFDLSNSSGTFKTPTGVTTIGGNLVVTGTKTGGTLSVLASSGNTTITAATSGSTRLFDSAAGITYTLPAPVVGLSYRFLWTVSQSSSNHIIITDAGTTFINGGNITLSATDVTPSATLGPKFFAANGTTHIKFTSNATTLGSASGSWLEFVCYDATHWFAYGVIDSPSGTIATPWST